jgi:hypothetical protein
MHLNANAGSLAQPNLFCLKTIFQNDMLTFGERIYFSNSESQLNFVTNILFEIWAYHGSGYETY